jgi:uncharacterized protein YbjT (DUF2867 family)
MATLTRPLPSLTLVIGGTGKTGRRVAERLWNAGGAVRLGHRSDETRFDWNDAATWPRALAGASAAYVTYHPDLLLPEAAGRIALFAHEAMAAGVHRLVLLSGRGEDGAERAEKALQASGAEWTVVRASWFMQNFNEGAFAPALADGTLALPVGDVGEPFIDADDIADVVLTVLGDPAYVGKTLELTGPRLLTFSEAVAEIAAAARRRIDYREVTLDAFEESLAEEGLGDEMRWLMRELFSTLFDGRNASTTDDVEAVLGRPARQFADFAAKAARTGAWPRSMAETNSRMTA